MRILLYLDPYPIRGSMVTQRQVAYKFARMFDVAGQVPDNCDYRLYSNYDVLAATIAKYPRVKDICLMPLETEQALFQQNLFPWLERGMQEWVALAKGEGLADQYCEILADIHARFPFDLVVHWGANGAVARFCDKNGLRRVAMEWGCTHKPYVSTIVFDPNGVRGNASPSVVDFADIHETVGGKGSSAALDLMTYGEPGGANLYEAQFQYEPTFTEQITGMASGRPIAFLPLPAHDDANLLLHSDFLSPTEVIDHLLPQLTEAGYFCFVKPHPAMLAHPGGGAELFRVHRSVYKHPNAFCIDPQAWGAESRRFLAVSDLVVTVNSSMGFEAMLHDKPVCVLGKAMYKPGNVFPTLDNVRSREIFEKDFMLDYRIKISVLRKFFLDAYLVPDTYAFELTAFTDRVLHLSGLRHSAAQAVQSIYNRFGPDGRQQRLARVYSVEPEPSFTPTKREQNRELANIQVRVSELLSSTSWRTTLPLRLAAALLRGSPYKDPSEPRSIEEGIRTIETVMSSGSWAVSWPLRLAKGWTAARRRSKDIAADSNGPT
ncbi:hypothetical protein [Microvirga sp. Mcv34]|uniref:capsular polysaccharide export protein, LipB/KpsS family n=1 Tax=Microvirga sp. Mcv34 TaxID=2926016 RepID=UPI0021C68911|nr:hypothetical protein [Microvirga sp. Mcv34]